PVRVGAIELPARDNHEGPVDITPSGRRSGEILLFDNLASSLPLYKTQRLRIVAVGSLQRIAALADLPTVAEAGGSGFESWTWFAIVAPPKSPPQLLDRLNKAVNEILLEPSLRSKFAELGVQPVGGTRTETNSLISRERKRWGDLIRAAGIEAN